ARGKSRVTVAQVRAVWLGKSIDKGLDGRQRILPRRERRHVCVCHLWQTHPQALIGAEKEQLVSLDRPAKHTAEILLPQRSLSCSFIVCKPIVGVERVIAEVFERRAVEGICARPRNYRNLSAGGPPELRREG